MGLRGLQIQTLTLAEVLCEAIMWKNGYSDAERNAIQLRDSMVGIVPTMTSKVMLVEN